MSGRHLEEVFKTCLQDVFSVTIFRLLKRLQAVFKTSGKCLPNFLEYYYADEMLKTFSRHVLKTSWRATNVWWDTPFVLQLMNYEIGSHSIWKNKKLKVKMKWRSISFASLNGLSKSWIHLKLSIFSMFWWKRLEEFFNTVNV